MEKKTGEDSCPIRSALPTPPSEIAATLAVLGGKWKILILWQLLTRACRFNELRRAIPGITQHMLTSHLRELESQAVVSRTVFAEVPPRVEYRLTEHGATLGLVLKAMAEWGALHSARTTSNAPGMPDPPRHAPAPPASGFLSECRPVGTGARP